MPASIHPDNPRVFLCRGGHVAKEAYGNTNYSCKKLITEDRPCKLKAIIIEEEFARSLYQRGWNARINWEEQVTARHDAAVEAIARAELDATETP